MKTVTFSPSALHDLEEWKNSDPKVLSKIISLITEIASTPFTGTGKPEPLKHYLKGEMVTTHQPGAHAGIRSA